MHFIGSNKYIITKIECWPVFKQDPSAVKTSFVARRSKIITKCTDDTQWDAQQRKNSMTLLLRGKKRQFGVWVTVFISGNIMKGNKGNRIRDVILSSQYTEQCCRILYCIRELDSTHYTSIVYYCIYHTIQIQSDSISQRKNKILVRGTNFNLSFLI